MKKDLDVVVIENNEYTILKEISHNSCTYLYLSNVVDDNDVMIRKIDNDKPDLIVPLDSDSEFSLACALMFKNDKGA